MRFSICVTQLMKRLRLNTVGVEKLCRKTKDVVLALLLFNARTVETVWAYQWKATYDAVYALLNIYGITRSKQAGHTTESSGRNAHTRRFSRNMINCKSERTTPAYPQARLSAVFRQKRQKLANTRIFIWQGGRYVRRASFCVYKTRMETGLRGRSLVVSGFQTFRKTLKLYWKQIAYLCPFQTFTIFVLVCKVDTHRGWLMNPPPMRSAVKIH